MTHMANHHPVGLRLISLVSLCILIEGTSLLGVSPAEAGGFTITVMGGRRTGMMTSLARPDDLTALLHNPAGLAYQPGVRTHLSISSAFLDTSFRLKSLDPERYPEINPKGCGTGSNKPCPWPIDQEGYYAEKIGPEKTFGVLPFLAASTDLAFITPKAKDFVVGLAIYSPMFYGAFLPEAAPTAYHIIEGTFVVISATAGVGWRINDKISIGASVSYNYMRLSFAQKYSAIDMLTAAGEAPDDFSKMAQSLVGDIRLDYTGVDHGIGWGLGILMQPSNWLAIGFNYTGASPARFEGDLALRALGKLVTDPNGLSAVMRDFGMKVPEELAVEMPIPHALMLGINISPLWWLEFGMDFRVWLYNFYSEQALIPIYKDNDPDLEEPISADSLSRDKNYGASFEFAAGFLFRPLKRFKAWELMMGGFYDHSPIPDETFTLDNPSLTMVAFSVGTRILVAKHWRLSASYMIQVFLPRDITTSTTSPPTNAQGQGINHLPGLEVEYIF